MYLCLVLFPSWSSRRCFCKNACSGNPHPESNWPSCLRDLISHLSENIYVKVISITRFCPQLSVQCSPESFHCLETNGLLEIFCICCSAYLPLTEVPLVLLAMDPVTSPGATPLPSPPPHPAPPALSLWASISQPSLSQTLKSPVGSCPTLLTLTCLCSFSLLFSCSLLLCLSNQPQMCAHPSEDSLSDSTRVSNTISSCNWIWARGIFSCNGSDALVNCVDLWHWFYSSGKDSNSLFSQSWFLLFTSLPQVLHSWV